MRELKFRVWDAEQRRWRKDWAITGYGILEPWHFMQYTGLKDKNGLEIWEKDIVRNTVDPDVGHIEIVEYQDYGFQPFSASPGFSWWMKAEWCEVLGNVYENPELKPGA